MDDDCEMILHVGLPKAGSSALQTALSMTPELTTRSGRALGYTALHQMGALTSVLRGPALTRAALRSPYGYASWPNMRADDTEAGVFEHLRGLLEEGRRTGVVPIASCEGWGSRAELFAEVLKRWGYPRVEVVAFLRPPVDWVNAAYWQWGIWNVLSLQTWMDRGNLPYGFGQDLEAWSQIPNVRLRLANARPDVVAKFATLYDVALDGALSSNTSSPPSLIGLLLRNRQFRPTPHDAATEFVFQRWCPPVEGRRPWAIRVPHVWQLRPVVQRNRTALERIATEEALADILSDARWTDERPYHAALKAGRSPLDDRAEMASLRASLQDGVRRASAETGRPVPRWQEAPGAEADVGQWDEMFRPMMQALLDADRMAREADGGRDLREVGKRLLRFLPSLPRGR